MQTKRRQDLATNLFYQIVMPEVDRASVELKVANKDAKAVAYVLRAKNVKKALEDYKDFKQMTKRFSAFKNGFLSLHAENDEVYRGIFTADVVNTLGNRFGELGWVELNFNEIEEKRKSSHKAKIREYLSSLKTKGIFRQHLAVISIYHVFFISPLHPCWHIAQTPLPSPFHLIYI